METSDRFDYQRHMKLMFRSLTTIGEMSKSIFKAYPARVRTQESVDYYEIGARNIDKDGEIVLLDSDTPRKSANTSAYEAQVLVAGDIVIPFRAKRLKVGIYRGSGFPLVPNPSLMVIRSGSILDGAYMAICLRQPFIRGYLDYLAERTGKLEIDDVAALAIPAFSFDFDYQPNNLFKITKMRYRLEQITEELNHYEETLKAYLLAGRVSYDQENLNEFNKLLDETERVNQRLNDSAPASENITMLGRDFRDFMENPEI